VEDALELERWDADDAAEPDAPKAAIGDSPPDRLVADPE
jgi:hypothetical protein